MKFQRYLKQIFLPGWILGCALYTVLSFTAFAEHTYVVVRDKTGHHLLYHISGDEILGSTKIGGRFNYGFSRDRIATLAGASRDGRATVGSLLKLFDARSSQEILSVAFDVLPLVAGPSNQVIFDEGQEFVYFITHNDEKSNWTRPFDLNVVDLGTGERLTYSLPSSVGYPSLLALRAQVGLFNTRSGTLFAFDVERRELGVALLGYGEAAVKAEAQGFSLAGKGIFRLENNLLVDVSQQLFTEIAGKSLTVGTVDSAYYRESGGISALAVREELSPDPRFPGLWFAPTARRVTSVLTFSTADSAKISQVEIPFATRVAPALSWDGRFLMFFDEDRGKLVFYDHRLGAFSDSVDLRSEVLVENRIQVVNLSQLGDVTLITRYD